MEEKYPGSFRFPTQKLTIGGNSSAWMKKGAPKYFLSVTTLFAPDYLDVFAEILHFLFCLLIEFSPKKINCCNTKLYN
jgi:hypothetical protein